MKIKETGVKGMEHFSKLDMYYLGQGTHYDIYKKLGAHPMKDDGSNIPPLVCTDGYAISALYNLTLVE